jgi:hypothetical protein
MNEKTQANQVEKKGAFEKLLIEVQKLNPSLGGFDELSMLLSLPDEQFALLAPIFLEELERSYNNVQDKIFIAQAVNAGGQKLEDIQTIFMKLI